MTYDSSTDLHIPARYYQTLFDALSGNNVLVQTDTPRFTVMAASASYLLQTGTTRETIIGRGIFDAFSGNTDPMDNGERSVRASFDHVLQYGEPHYLPIQRYDVAGEDGGFVERYWKTSNKPVFSPEGDIAYILHCAEDITQQVKAREREIQLEGIEKAFGLFMHAPMVVGLVNGENYVLEMANEAAFKFWGKDPKSVIGKPLFDGLPELRNPEIIERFNQVQTSGQPYVAYEVPVAPVVPGAQDQYYFNLVYQPYYGNGPRPTGVFMISHDVTEQVKARQKAQESEEKYRALFESMDEGYCTLGVIFNGDKCVDYRYLETNPTFDRHLGLTDALGKTIREIAPDIEPKWFDFYGGVALTGIPIRITEESPALNKWYEVYAIRVGNPEERKVGVFFTDITESKRAEEALAQSENNLRNMILQAPVAMAILKGPSFVVEIANDRMFELWGRGRNELLGHPLFERLLEVKDQGYEEILTGVFTTGERFVAQGIPVTLPRPDGLQTVFVDLLYEAFREADGSIAGVMVVAMDVTGQLLARRKIEESETRFRTMAESTPVLIAVANETGHATYFNKAWSLLTGRPMEQLLEYGWVDLVHPEDKARYVTMYRDAIALKGPFTAEFRVSDPQGAYRWLLAHGVPRFNNEGDYVGYISSCTDVTRQKQSQKQLETALEQVRLSKDAAELGTFDMDLENGFMHWDDRCRTLFGISHNRPVTFEKDFVEGLHPDDRERVLNVVDHAFIQSVSDGDYDVEYRTVGAEDAVIRWVRAKGKVYFNRQGEASRFIGSVLDISEKVLAIQKVEHLVEERTRQLAEANESLRQANEELQRSNASLEEFTYAASHDLKEPIRKIAIFSNQLKMQLANGLQENESRLFGRIENATERMASLVDDLLLYSHVTEKPHETESVDLNVKVQKVLEDVELDVEEKKAVVKVSKLPVVNGYKRQLQQLFQNLITNALKYSKSDVPPHIVISAAEHMELGRRYHVISVQDNGIGFEQQYSGKIFQMFTRLHTKAEYSGTGVGLSIVKKVVSNHNGFIRVESTPGVGSTFRVWLPAD